MKSDRSANTPFSKELYEQRQLEAIAAHWNAKAAGWDRELGDPACHLNEDHAYERFLEQLASVISSQAEFCRRTGIIDAGCATGLVLEKAVPAFSWGIGVDISAEMIRLAEAKNIPKSRFVKGDCFSLGAICPPAGAVVSRGVLLSHYGPQQGEALLRSTRSCLVDGGFVFCDFLNHGGRAKYHHVALNKTYFRSEEVCALAARAGFRGIKVYGEPERRVLVLCAQR